MPCRQFERSDGIGILWRAELIMDIVALVMAGFLAAFSFVPLVRRDDWWIRIFDFPRMQILVLAVTTLAVYIAFRGVTGWLSGAVLSLLGPAVLIQGFRILPYTPLFPKEVIDAKHADQNTGEPGIALLIANVLMTNRNAGRLIQIIGECDPDIVLALEPDDWWEGQLRVLEERYAYTVKEPRSNRYGMLLYSRLELIEPQVRHIISEKLPSMHARVRLAPSRTAWLHCLHPEPPSPTEAEDSTRRDAELLVVGREVQDRRTPTIVSGDLNDVAWSHTTTLFQKISRLLDPRKGRGMFNTYHAKYPFMRWPLDHVFHSRQFTLAEMIRLPAFGSDHFPVYVHLVLEPEAEELQEGVDPEPKDREKTTSKIEDAKTDERRG